MSWAGSIYKTAVEIDFQLIAYDISRLADQGVLPACGSLWQPLAASGGPSRDPPDPLSNTFQLFDASMARLFDASMLAAGLSLVLVAG